MLRHIIMSEALWPRSSRLAWTWLSDAEVTLVRRSVSMRESARCGLFCELSESTRGGHRGWMGLSDMTDGPFPITHDVIIRSPAAFFSYFGHHTIGTDLFATAFGFLHVFSNQEDPDGMGIVGAIHRVMFWFCYRSGSFHQPGIVIIMYLNMNTQKMSGANMSIVLDRNQSLETSNRRLSFALARNEANAAVCHAQCLARPRRPLYSVISVQSLSYVKQACPPTPMHSGRMPCVSIDTKTHGYLLTPLTSSASSPSPRARQRRTSAPRPCTRPPS